MITPRIIECPFENVSRKLTGGYYLYAHPDLRLSEFKMNGSSLILLGDLFGYDGTHQGNLEILEDLCRKEPEDMLQQLDGYTGCFVLIIMTGMRIVLAHDAMAAKKIYYFQDGDKAWMASQPHLLAGITGQHPSASGSKTTYYKSEDFRRLNNASIGNTTMYDRIFQVMPNHCFEPGTLKPMRYWPRKRVEAIPLDECIEMCIPLIKGYVENIASRYDVMLPVTAGKDSRTLLSATRDVRDRVYYYINLEKNMNKRMKDVRIPEKLFRSIGLEYHVLDVDIPVEDDFREVYFKNNCLASEYYLPNIYNYYLHFGDRVNLPGHIATGANWWWPNQKDSVRLPTLVRLNGLQGYEHAREAYTAWLDGAGPRCRDCGFNLIDLFYWEERLGNWGTQVQLDKEMAQLEFNPFNSRLLAGTILSIKERVAIDKGSYLLNRGIIERLWPELLSVPINPSIKNRFVRVLEFLGWEEQFFHLWFRYF